MSPPVDSALDKMLREGRLSTLERWIKYGRDQSVSSPLFDLADAEITFRRGDLYRAHALARQAAEDLSSNHRFYARALLRAGQTAHLSNREDLALMLHKQAKSAANTPEEAVEAVVGQLSAALDLEIQDADRTHEQLERIEATNPEIALRVLIARLVFATRRGALDAAFQSLAEANRFVSSVKDPLARSSFFYVASYALALGGRYRRALQYAEAAILEAECYRLSFALGHAFALEGDGSGWSEAIRAGVYLAGQG